MSFCPHCGNEITPGARFCGSCGKEQPTSVAICPKCNKKLEENEKYCSNCGTAINIIPNPVSEKETEPQNSKLTNEGRKIIDAGPKSGSKRPVKKSPATKHVTKSKSPQKKRRSPLGCFFRTIVILVSIVISAAVIIFIINIFIGDNESTTSGTQEITTIEEDPLTGTDIPGIVDIEPVDESNSTNQESEQANYTSVSNYIESESLKKSTKKVEDAFSKGDILLVKQQLTESAQMQYNELFELIQPYMKDYAETFKKRKLSVSTALYKEYEFFDNSGKKYSAAFALQPNGEWKLVRF